MSQVNVSVNGVEYAEASNIARLERELEFQKKHLHETHLGVVRLYGETAALTRRLHEKAKEVARLRSAITEHRKGLLRGGPEAGLDVTEADRNLWAVLNA